MFLAITGSRACCLVTLDNEGNSCYFEGKFREIFRDIIRVMIHITELARMIGASVDELRYLEKKGFVHPVRARLKQREVRQYYEDDVSKLENIIRYRRQGFTWDAAYHKAMEALKKPSLFEHK
jgi:hypothetical protein